MRAVLHFILPLLILAAGVGVFAGLMAFREPPAEAQPDQGLPIVSASAALPFDGNLEVRASGLVVPYREITLTAEVDGRIVEKTDDCQSGKFVAAGTTLIRIDDSNYRLEVTRLEAELEQARGNANEMERQFVSVQNQIEIAEMELAIREKELTRFTQISDPGVFSETEVDNARRNRLIAKNAAQSLKDELELLKARRKRLAAAVDLVAAQLERAKLDLARCEIKASADGVVVAERVEEDTFVSRGTTLALLEDTSKVEIECNLRVEEIRTIRRNSNAEIGPYELPPNEVIVEYETDGERVTWPGTLARVNGVGVDSKTRTVPCLVEVEQPVHPEARGIRTLVRGMFVNLRVQVESQQPLVAIPAEALQGKDTVWVVVGGKLRKVNVDVMPANRDDLARLLVPDEETALSGSPDELIVVRAVPGLLEAGGQVVTTPVTYAIENQPVELAEEKPARQAGATS